MLKKTFKSIDRGLMFVEEWSLFAAVCVALITAMANVVLRKLTSDLSLYWSDEVVRKVIFFSTYIGCVAAVRSRSLIRIDALPQIVPVLKKPLTLFSHLAALIFSAIMIRLGWSMTVMMYQDEYAVSTTLRIPEWYFYVVLPIFGGMLFLRTLIVMIEDWTGKMIVTEPKAD